MTTRIAIDIDGVLFNFTEKLRAVAEKLWPGRIAPDFMPTDWKWASAGLVDEDMDKIWEVIRGTKDFWVVGDAYADNVSALKTFLSLHRDVEVYYITSRARTLGAPLLTQTQKWLNGHSLITSYTSIIPVESGVEKGRVIDVLGIGFSIDDYEVNVRSNIRTNRRHGNPHKAFLLDQPWNAAQKDLDNVRVPSLLDFLTIVVEAK